jgi:hypothetical protein
MSCKQCDSEQTKTFPAEVAIRFAGVNSLEKPIVFVFANLVVCLRCGLTEFRVPANELSVLVTGNPVPEVMISWEW